MKKIVMLVLFLLGVGGAGAGYYLFVMKPEREALEAANLAELERLKPKIQPQEPKVEQADPEPEPITDYYVNPAKLAVRTSPSEQGFIESFVYRGDKLHILEKQQGWGRVTPYYVYEEGGEEVAEWVKMDQLLEVAPTITREERLETVSQYVEKSDDFKDFFDMFTKTADQLLKDGTCTPEDFDELGGWVRSNRFEGRDVYFVYCGGLKQEDKIYLDVQTGELSYP